MDDPREEDYAIQQGQAFVRSLEDGGKDLQEDCQGLQEEDTWYVQVVWWRHY